MKKAIVVGASSGIGKELALLLSKDKFVVGITGRRKEKLEELKAIKPDSFIIKSFDCTSENNTQKLEELTEELGGLDLLILSSGTGDLNEGLDYDIELRTNKLNVLAFTEIVGWAYKYFDNQGEGQLVGISSIGGLRGSKAGPAYNASKAYQINYLEGLRQKAQGSGKNITITDIRPGLVDTDMAKGENLKMVAPREKAAKQIIKHIKKKIDIGYVTRPWRMVAVIMKLMPNFIYKRL